MRRPVKYRCINCKRDVREGERHDYVRCVSGTTRFTLLIDWIDDRAGKALAIIATIVSVLAAASGYTFTAIVLLALIATILGHELDMGDRRG